MTSSSRDLVLSRLRAALGSSAPAPAPPAAVPPSVRRAADPSPAPRVAVPRHYRPAGRPASLETLIDRLAAYRAVVHRVPEDAIASTVTGLVGGAVVVPGGLPHRWRPAGALVDDGLAPDRIAGADAVLTAAAVAVAETGTIVLDGSADQGRRIITLLPDVHFCVLRPEQVVAAVPDAVARLDPRRPLTWISGPSATSDIELNRVEGVHGPRHLHVLLLDG